jgi:phosphoribosylformylglycinamidine synthase
MRSGWVRACHDLSEGGLAVTAAEMCLGGWLGLDLRLSGSVPAAALFGETNACLLVEVRRAHQADFEALFVGLPWHIVGRVIAEPRLVIAGPSGVWIDLPLDDLLRAWLPAGERA